MRLTAALEV